MSDYNYIYMTIIISDYNPVWIASQNLKQLSFYNILLRFLTNNFCTK